jgi:hypothetical protein
LVPFKNDDILSQKQQFTHSRSSADDLQKTLGLIKIIGSYSCEKHWAHSKPSANSLQSNAVPIQAHQPILSCESLGYMNDRIFSQKKCCAHLMVSLYSLLHSNEPIQNYWQLLSRMMLGLFKTVGRFSSEQSLAHTRQSSSTRVSSTRPIQDYQQLLLRVALGPLIAIRNFSQKQGWTN